MTWSDPIIVAADQGLPVSDPDTGAPVRSGEPLPDITVDPNSGNLYIVWADGRFSGFTHDDIALAMSADGGRTWSAPVKVNQTPQNIPAGNQQAFTPSVAVAADGTVAVTYYDFRNNTLELGLPTDYWMVHAHPDSGLTNPSSWGDELRLTDTSFDMENAPVADGYFVGDYEGLAAAGNTFLAFFSQTQTQNDPATVFFRAASPVPASPIVAGASSASILGVPTGANLLTLGIVPEDLIANPFTPKKKTLVYSMLEK
jgi:hypothetical protein